MNPDNRQYVFNLETTKIELRFEKAEYDAFSDEQKRELKGAFLWSSRGGCWVSRAKEPNLYRAKQVAEKLGFTGEQREGERLTYAEQLKRQAGRAEARADRLEGYAVNAEGRAAQLQKPLNDLHGDIAFFTQPNINSAGGKAFKNYRDKLFARYYKGFEEYRKSDYFKERAETARETATQAQFDDPGYLDRRIRECQKEIRNREKNVIYYEKILFAVESGAKKTWRDGEPVNVENVTVLLKRELELVEKAMDKQGYLENRLSELGGCRFSKDNIKVGYIVRVGERGQAEIISAGSVNVGCKILTGGAAGRTFSAVYAEISEVIKAEEKKPDAHPFKVGEQFTVVSRDYSKGIHNVKTTETLYEIVKASDTTIQLKAIGTDDKAIIRKPVKTYSGKWRFSINDTHGNTFYKAAEPNSEKEGLEQERPSAMNRLAAAKEVVVQNDTANVPQDKAKDKSHGAEL